MSIATRFYAHETKTKADSPMVRKVAHKFEAMMKAMQHAQMVSALNRVPDIYLNEAGVRRCDIPGHARRLVYGDE